MLCRCRRQPGVLEVEPLDFKLQSRKLLDYVKGKNEERYQSLITRLGIRR